MMFVGWMLAAAAAPTTAPPLQAQFEQATAALLASQWATAADGFHAIGERSGLSPRTRSIVAMREGQALFHLDRDNAAAMLQKGLDLAPSDPALKDDRVDALMTLGNIERNNFDFVAARREFEAARALSDDPLTQITSLMSLANVTMFDGDGAALVYADAALKFIETHKVEAAVDGQIHNLRGEVLLNRGDTAGALVDLNIALKDFGGLTTKTNLDDVHVRADLVLAYLLAKKREKAQSFIGMTGEGRAPDNAMLGEPSDGNLPSCGGETKPDDVVVVEFGIADDGAVIYARPVYASHSGPMAVEFARAVYGWSWQPEKIKNIPFFYRARPRVEIRCTMTATRPSPISLLKADVYSWLGAHNVPTMDNQESEARRVPKMRAALAEQEKKGADDISTVPLLIGLAESFGTSFDEARAMHARAGTIAAAAQAPVPVRTYFAIRAVAPASDKRRDTDAYIARLGEMLKTSTMAADARSAATLRLTIAQARSYRDPTGASALLDAIIAEKELDRHDPLRVGALLQLASLKAQQKDLVAARHYYDLTGLSDQQCALVDAQPVRVRGMASEQDYPQEARNWGLSGWARTEFDINADGSTAHVRTVMAYPAFVFGPSIEGVVAHQKYTQTFRPEGGLGCGGNSFQQGFHYVIPGAS